MTYKVLALVAAFALTAPLSAAQEVNFGTVYTTTVTYSDHATIHDPDVVTVSDSVQLFSKGLARVSDSPVQLHELRAYLSAQGVIDALSVADRADLRLPLPPMSVSESPVLSDRATAVVSVPPPPPPPPSPAIIRGGSGPTGVALAVVHGVSWNACGDRPVAQVTASPGDAGLKVALARDGSSVRAHLIGQAAAPPGAGVWQAPVAQSSSPVTVTAQLSGGNSDAQEFVADSCSGSAGFTAFHSPGLISREAPPAQPASPLEQAGPDPVDADRSAPAEPVRDPLARSEPDSEPPSPPAETGEIRVQDGAMWEVNPAPVLTDEPGSASLQDEPAPTSIRDEPLGGEPSPPDAAVWLAVLAAAAAAVGVAAWRLNARRRAVAPRY